MLTTFVIFLLATYGATNIINAGEIFSGLRSYIGVGSDWLWRQLTIIVNCPMCLGWWVGLFWYLIGLYPDTELNWTIEWLSAACVGSGFSWIVRVVLSKLGEDSL